MGTAAGGSGSIVRFVHKKDCGPIEGGDRKVKTDKPIGKRMLMFKMGLKVLFKKILCQKRKSKNYSPEEKVTKK